jgi:hypothetical protein
MISHRFNQICSFQEKAHTIKMSYVSQCAVVVTISDLCKKDHSIIIHTVAWVQSNVLFLANFFFIIIHFAIWSNMLNLYVMW